MRTLQKQRGLTFISWLIILIVAGFLAMVGIKITPVYLDHFAVKTVMESVKNEPFSARKSVRELRKMILNRLNINSIGHVTKDHLSIKRAGGMTTINIAYEERRPVAYNISLVMTFDETVELTAN
ncbi:MAG: DUF4845 domain-containing protein [Candidatus Thiodiazotropha sp. (ex Lucinoma borealis)]|nr:DUF4845 domain-containing protein [Candidatus Thiodiazotropha sp. (ex Lucinoma borealis)]MCU7840322.1 DUF4845 domain-containing protein [Candidatus Thiodiazotropha sp. (ex Troendleina suluensis)]MCU7854517.1 DUF4845 domain-containing protein [Candidatus Thiodiazotropha sp. (ex Lucinoma borealis)]MCU7869983.1 DUF4845 domain-containing protein [Candidatus Thiodiazotropha sp. (ex Lucinoma borealis)]